MAILPSGETFLKAILIPASIALALFLFFSYVLYPIYAHRQRYAQYLPVSLSSDEYSQTLLGRTTGGIGRALDPVRNTAFFAFAAGMRDAVWDMIVGRLPGMHRYHARNTSFDAEYYGDEELEDGVLDDIGTRREGIADSGVERRLSRDLEAGFRDDSDDDEADDDRRRTRR